jgi:hypothetical protein
MKELSAMLSASLTTLGSEARRREWASENVREIPSVAQDCPGNAKRAGT